MNKLKAIITLLSCSVLILSTITVYLIIRIGDLDYRVGQLTASNYSLKYNLNKAMGRINEIYVDVIEGVGGSK